MFIALPIAIGLGTEIAQAFGIIEGVFDPLDLTGMTIATFAAVLTVGMPGIAALPPSPRAVHPVA
jgi:hypothetical protein